MSSPIPSQTVAPHDVARSPDRTDDLRLRDALVAGEQRAWKAFRESHGRLVTATIARIVRRFGALGSSEDVQEIEAIFSVELLANGCAKLRAYQPDRGARFSTWITLLATHAAYDFLRRRRREPLPDPETETETLVAETADPYALCELGERARLVETLVSGFSRKDRQFLELYFAEGLEPDQVASRMGISVKTVYSKKHKIQGRLEAMLEHRRLAA